MFDTLTDQLDARNENGEVSDKMAAILEYLIGAANGLTVVILNYIYGKIVDVVVIWENHE